MTPPTIIVWRDAYAAAAHWIQADDIPDPPVMVTSVGWIIDGMADGYTVVADSRFERDSQLFYGGVTYIPNGMIVDVS